jgi:hypothetical protein
MRRAAAWPTRNAALEVHPQHAVEVGLFELEKIGAVDDAGVVHDDVEIAKGAAGFGHHVLGRERITRVGGDEVCITHGTCRGCTGGIDVGDGDARAFGGIAPGDREPDAARPAGDDGDLVLEPHAALRLLLESSAHNGGNGALAVIEWRMLLSANRYPLRRNMR